MKDKLISIDEIKSVNPIFRGRFGNIMTKAAIKITGVNQINQIYDNSKQFEGVEFCDHLLKGIGLNLVVENRDVLKQFKDQAFITVSNHAYGHIDGIAAIDIVGSVRSDYKMMVNFILGMIDTMEMHFIAVNPYQKGAVSDHSSLDGVKQCITHLKEGHPLGFFPAGAVSKTHLKGLKMYVEDREWQPSVIKLIKKANVPVIPLYFSGGNSSFFNFLDLVDWRLRSLRLGHELSNKRGKTMHMRFGEPIMPGEIAQYKDIVELGEFLKQKTYSLAKDSD